MLMGKNPVRQQGIIEMIGMLDTDPMVIVLSMERYNVRIMARDSGFVIKVAGLIWVWLQRGRLALMERSLHSEDNPICTRGSSCSWRNRFAWRVDGS
jgi:hypothetical protein